MQRHSTPMLLAFEAKQTHAEKCTAALQKRFSKKPKNPDNRYAISKKRESVALRGLLFFVQILSGLKF